MSSFFDRLFKKVNSRQEKPYPKNMQDLQPGDPCWCGSNKVYRQCHRKEDRKREKALGLHRRGKSVCDVFT